jgi:hypothetical protein
MKEKHKLMMEEIANLYGFCCGSAALNVRQRDGEFELPINEEVYRRTKVSALRRMIDGEVEPHGLAYTWGMPMSFPINAPVTDEEAAEIFIELNESLQNTETPFAKAVKLNPEIGLMSAIAWTGEVDPDYVDQQQDESSIRECDKQRWNAAVNELLVVASKYPFSPMFSRIRRVSSKLPLFLG